MRMNARRLLAGKTGAAGNMKKKTDRQSPEVGREDCLFWGWRRCFLAEWLFLRCLTVKWENGTM